METIKKILDWLNPKPLWAKIVAIIVVLALSVLLLCSCGSTMNLPDVSDYKVGAEGVVSKEKTTTKQTKWFFKPDETTQNSN